MMVQAIRVWAFLAIGSIAFACGENAAEEADTPPPLISGASADEIEDQPIPFDSLPMPDYPEPRRGYLVARGAGSYTLDGEWPAVARMCDDPPIMQVVAQQPGEGTLVLLQLPPESKRLAEYPVTIVEQGFPPAPASQIGVQKFQGGNVSTFQAMDGLVTVYGFGQRISGQFAVVLREVSLDERQKYAGTFESVLIEQIPEAECRQIKEALAVPDSAASDSTSQ